jgi:hypothetical protein
MPQQPAPTVPDIAELIAEARLHLKRAGAEDCNRVEHGLFLGGLALADAVEQLAKPHPQPAERELLYSSREVCAKHGWQRGKDGVALSEWLELQFAELKAAREYIDADDAWNALGPDDEENGEACARVERARSAWDAAREAANGGA